MRLKVLAPSQAMKDDSGKANVKTMGSQENELPGTDCHEIVKSSGQQGARRRKCCVSDKCLRTEYLANDRVMPSAHCASKIALNRASPVYRDRTTDTCI